MQDHEELLGYLDDLLRQHSKCITEEGITFTDRFIDAFINECLSLIMQSLGCYKTHFGIKTSLLVLSLLLKNITNQLVTETIVLALFGRYYSSALANIILKPILSVKSYDKVWKFKGFWDNYQASINKYCV